MLIIINTSTKVTWHNFDDLVRQCYWVWGDMADGTACRVILIMSTATTQQDTRLYTQKCNFYF